MKSIDYTEIGQKIRQSRIAHSYSQEQLAELTGISTAFLGHIERGTRAIPGDAGLYLFSPEYQY